MKHPASRWTIQLAKYLWTAFLGILLGGYIMLAFLRPPEESLLGVVIGLFVPVALLAGFLISEHRHWKKNFHDAQDSDN